MTNLGNNIRLRDADGTINGIAARPNPRTDRYAALRAMNVPFETKHKNAAAAIDASYAAFESGRAFVMEDGDGYHHIAVMTDTNIQCDCLAPDGSSNGIASMTDFDNWERFCAQAVHLGYRPLENCTADNCGHCGHPDADAMSPEAEYETYIRN